MEEGELEEARKRKLAAKQKEQEAKAAESQLREVLRSVLTEAAYDRMTNVALANKELYIAAAQQVLMASKRMGRRISEEELLTVLRAIKARTEKESTITFHKK
jgi:DNA-binding TFAR19-related protein (PDSD5 family)